MRLIDAHELYNELVEMGVRPNLSALQQRILNEITGMVLKAPTIEAHKKGKWEKQHIANTLYVADTCSLCGHQPDEISSYCPHCGAEMEVENASKN